MASQAVKAISAADQSSQAPSSSVDFIPLPARSVPNVDEVDQLIAERRDQLAEEVGNTPDRQKLLEQYSRLNEDVNEKLFRVQFSKEANVIRDAIVEFDDLMTSKDRRTKLERLGPVKRLKLLWYPQLFDAISHRQNVLARTKRTSLASRYVRALGADVAAMMLIQETLDAVRHAATEGVPLIALCTRIGEAVEAELALLELEQRDEAEVTRLERKMMESYRESGSSNSKMRRQLFVFGSKLRDESFWTNDTHIQVGAELLNVLLSVAKIRVDKDGTQLENAFEMIVGSVQGRPPDWLNIFTEMEVREKETQAQTQTLSTADDGLLSPAEERTQKALEEESKLLPEFVTRTDGRVQDLTAEEMENALLSDDARVGRLQQYTRIRAHWMLHTLLDYRHYSADQESLYYMFKPLVIKPFPWTPGRAESPYLLLRAPMMKSYGNVQQERLLLSGSIQSVTDGLNVLGMTPWRINERVLDVARALFREGGDAGGIPSVFPVRVPARVDFRKLREIEDEEERKLRKEELRQQARKHYIARKLNMERHSLSCSYSLKLNVAEEFRAYDQIYFPCNIDFRGRAYPIPPHLNHMGQDLDRGLLAFADRKPLGDAGWKWLRVHLANVCGVDKISNDDRRAWADKLIADGVVSAVARAPSSPDGISSWWREQENPFQVLATCLEIQEALDNSDGPENYASGLPVHQDGSCNGLQHYAALGRDASGAISVNLVDGDKPADVYTAVLRRVQEKLHEIATAPEHEGHEFREHAQKLDGKLVRKTIKQTVMTSVYGVTVIGARAQIGKQLKPRRDEFGFDGRQEFRASLFLAKLTLDGLQEQFSDAWKIMKWLQNAAKVIAHSDHMVKWVTPLGLPCVQPYRSDPSVKVNTVMASLKSTLKSDEGIIDLRSQTMGYPPNFVHSLDASHMLMTALKCKERDMSFTAVHDSYWTHACDVSEMSSLLREAFVELHSQELMKNLRSSFCRRYPECEFEPLPQPGSFDLEQVRSSTYFFC